jgi:DNA repair exonuclease SbcCD ATPase subunit
MAKAGEPKGTTNQYDAAGETLILKPVAGSPITQAEVVPIPNSVTAPAPGRDLAYVFAYSREVQEIHAVLLDARLHNLEMAIIERFKSQPLVKKIMGSPAYKDKVDEIYTKVRSACDTLQEAMDKTREIREQEDRLAELSLKLEKQMAQLADGGGRPRAQGGEQAPAQRADGAANAAAGDLERQRAAFESEKAVWSAQMKQREDRIKEEHQQVMGALQTLDARRKEFEADRRAFETSTTDIRQRLAELKPRQEALDALEERLRRTETDLKQTQDDIQRREATIGGREEAFFGAAKSLVDHLIHGNADLVRAQRGIATDLSRMIETYLRNVDAWDLENAKRIKELLEMLPGGTSS